MPGQIGLYKFIYCIPEHYFEIFINIYFSVESKDLTLIKKNNCTMLSLGALAIVKCSSKILPVLKTIKKSCLMNLNYNKVFTVMIHHHKTNLNTAHFVTENITILFYFIEFNTKETKNGVTMSLNN